MKVTGIRLVVFLFALGVSCSIEWTIREQSALLKELGSIRLALHGENETDSNLNFETFVDDSLVGRSSGKDKVEIRCSRKGGVGRTVIIFYRQGEAGRFEIQDQQTWEPKQSYYFESEHTSGCEPQIRDFNGDRYWDIDVRSHSADGGTTDIKRFIFDGEQNGFSMGRFIETNSQQTINSD